ncbi:hypothetical protein VNO78_09459 [Psophocarpus tetragonolobus]|uniref:Uncharacterized protein n=1 Tax=Psophocarpus tetragonolobus TaxID=3891 RepID=A0AAN9SYD4_PSOTE
MGHIPASVQELCCGGADCDSVEVYYEAIHYNIIPEDVVTLALKAGDYYDPHEFEDMYVADTIKISSSQLMHYKEGTYGR